MFINPRLIAAVAPDALSVFITKIAPKTIISTSSEDKRPRIEFAAIASKSTYHTKKARTAAIAHEIIRHHFAGQLKASISTRVAKIGKNATIGKIISDMIELLI